MNIRQKLMLKYMMLNSSFPFDFIYLSEDTVNLLLYIGESKNVKVPKKYDGTPIVEINSTCFAANDDIEKVKIANGITAIY